MINIPRPEVIEYDQNELPSEFARLSAFAPLYGSEFAPTEPARAPSVAQWLSPAHDPVAPELDFPRLDRFKNLMNAHGWPVHTARMLFDRKYAYDRLVLASSSQDAELRRFATELFGVYRRRGAAH